MATWVAGQAGSALWLRRTIAPWLRDRPGLVYAVAAVAFVLVLVFSPTGQDRRLWGILGLGGMLVLGVEPLRRQTAREFPDAAGATVALPGWLERPRPSGHDDG